MKNRTTSNKELLLAQNFLTKVPSARFHIDYKTSIMATFHYYRCPPNLSKIHPSQSSASYFTIILTRQGGIFYMLQLFEIVSLANHPTYFTTTRNERNTNHWLLRDSFPKKRNRSIRSRNGLARGWRSVFDDLSNTPDVVKGSVEREREGEGIVTGERGLSKVTSAWALSWALVLALALASLKDF